MTVAIEGKEWLVPRGRARISVADVVAYVARDTQLSEDEITGTSRLQELVRARFAVVWLAHRHTKVPQKRIAWMLGRRDPSTISHALGRALQLRETDAAFRLLTDWIADDFPPEGQVFVP